jgi:phage protein U
MEYGQFGSIVFQVVHFRNLTEENTFLYAHQETAQAPSTLQFLGEELRKIELTLRFHPEFSNPEEDYEKLKTLSRKGSAQKLIIGTKVLGDFVIEKISGEFIKIDAWGKPILIDAHLELSEYKEKELKTRKIKTVKKTPAKTSNPKQAEYQCIINRENNTRTVKKC